jgi:hypothetical protein
MASMKIHYSNYPDRTDAKGVRAVPADMVVIRSFRTSRVRTELLEKLDIETTCGSNTICEKVRRFI